MDARSAALAILQEVDQGAYAHLAMKQILEGSGLGHLDRALVTELAYGCIRRQNTLDHIAGQYLRRQKDLPAGVRRILRMGVYQLLYMDRIPPSAAVNESVKLCVSSGMPGMKGLVNAVLRNVERARGRNYFSGITDAAQRISLELSHPAWMVREFIRRYGAKDAVDLMEYNNRPQPNILRVNTLRTTRNALWEQWKAKGYTLQDPGIPDTIQVGEGTQLLGGIGEYKGLFHPQSAAGILAALALGARPGEAVLDCCAAPGGKAFVLAQQMEDTGTLLCTDIHPHRIRLLENGAATLGVKGLRAEVRDWTCPQDDLAGRFDRVLADVPCSGLGVLAGRPDARWRRSRASMTELAGIQRKILSQSAQAVCPGGILLYVTCTLTGLENEENREWFLENHPGFQADPFVLPAPFLAETDRDALSQGHIELQPFRHGVEGFYLACFRRNR